MKTDILVIGAGPAGSIACALLARLGRQVLCLEAGVFPRFQIGESLLPRCNDILDEAGLLSVVQARNFMPKPAALFLQGEMRERFSFADMFPGQRPAAMQVPRDDFDQTLATEARRMGADIRFQQRVDTIAFNGTQSVVQVTDVETGARSTVEAKFVIDCSGYGRVLPKLLELEKAPSLGPRVAIFNHFEGDLRPTGPEEGDIWACIHPRGPWTWIIPFKNGRTSVGVVAERAMAEAAGANDRERLLTLLSQDPNTQGRLGQARPVLKTARLEGWSAAVSKIHGPGWALTGNASEFLDPIFSSGVTLALESSSRAAKLAHRQLSGEAVDWDKEYAAVMDRAIGVFRVFVHSWYSGELQKVLLHQNKPESIKRAITAVLGGYVLDERNPFVRDANRTLTAAVKLA
ncbi:MAG: binding domain protein [Myxococcaceae bacterium]|nr:binding domain protein [Myxococcaceae bacterium]